MANLYDQEFQNIAFDSSINSNVYEECVFRSCKFSGHIFLEVQFMDCEFIDCDFSNTKVNSVSFKNVQFKGCKLLAFDFSTCNKFLLEMNFEDCNLSMSTFYQLHLAKTTFKNCNLSEVDFVEASLAQSRFIDCDLNSAIFDRTDLQKADLSTSYGFTIDPEINRIKGAKISREGLSGLLDKYKLKIV